MTTQDKIAVTLNVSVSDFLIVRAMVKHIEESGNKDVLITGEDKKEIAFVLNKISDAVISTAKRLGDISETLLTAGDVLS